MKQGTKIHYRGSEYNKDGDRPVNFENIASITSENLQSAIDDPELHFMQITKDKIFGIDKLSFKEHKFLLLEPNPVTFYFSLAFDAINQMEQVIIDFCNLAIQFFETV
jgi:hypothetical protein